MRRTRRNVPDDSDESDSGSESSDSDVAVRNRKAQNTTQPSTKRKPGGLARNAKRQRVQDNTNDTSPQPSTSRGTANSQNSIDDSDEDSSESESPDSDYGPVKDRSLLSRKKKLPGRKAKAPKKTGNTKKKKERNNSVNGVSSHKGSESRNHLNTSSRKSASNDVTFDAKQVESLAQKLVYFLFVEDQKKYAIRRKAITTHVFKDEMYSPKLYIAVMKRANFILKKTYGMELMEVENQKDSYLIVNMLERELGIHEYVEVSRLKQQQHGLILYLLTIIFMNDNVITEDELTKSLKQFGIDLTSKKLHPVFGDVKKYITSELVKQMYLIYECVSKDPPKYEIKWGIRAKQEFDKRDLLQFACQIMEDTTPESWRIQYKDAEKSANPKENGSN